MYIKDVNIDHRSEPSELEAVEQRSSGGWPLQAQGVSRGQTPATEEWERGEVVIEYFGGGCLGFSAGLYRGGCRGRHRSFLLFSLFVKISSHGLLNICTLVHFTPRTVRCGLLTRASFGSCRTEAAFDMSSEEVSLSLLNILLTDRSCRHHHFQTPF